MKKNLIVDYLGCILFKAVSSFTCFLPLNFILFSGRRLGDLIYFFDRKHRRIANANIRYAFGRKINSVECEKITRKAYRAFGQNLIEISVIGRIDKKYLEKYIHIENKNIIQDAFDRGKGVIFLGIHEGNWELSNIICANLGFSFTLFVRDQGLPRLNRLLNSYRQKLGAKIIHKHAGARGLIESLKANQSVGMTIDQGGKSGRIVKFFGKEASMAVGAVKLALKYDCAIIPVFYTRIKGPHIKVILDSIFTVRKSQDPQSDLINNLQSLTSIFERYIDQYPHEYLWTYKIWKYGKERDLLVLSDGKTGHLRQSQGLARMIGLKLGERGLKVNLIFSEVKFRSNAARFVFNFFQNRFFMLLMLDKESYCRLMVLKPDIIVSAGSSLGALNYFLAGENRSRSVCLMRPGSFNVNKFDLAVIPRHDQANLLSFKSNNILVTEGALNLVDPGYLAEKAGRLEESGLLKKGPLNKPSIGLLIGGNSKNFSITEQTIAELCSQIKISAEEFNSGILISTSRRTNSEIERQISDSFEADPRCRLLVIANKNNSPDVVGGLLALSDIIITSPESISMISEAVTAEKYVIVFKNKGLSKKHRHFLRLYEEKNYIYFKEVGQIASWIKRLWQEKPKLNFPRDNLKVVEAINRLI